MRTSDLSLIILLVFFIQAGVAQEKRLKEPLETGFERKLGLVYKTVGKRELAFDVYYPKTGIEKPFPTIVYTHGGGWAAGSRFNAAKGQFAPLFRALTERGFCIVSVDYRLTRKGGSVRMRDCVIDSKDAIRYLVKNNGKLNIDPEQIFVFGDSAGGHIAQMLLLTPPASLPGDENLTDVDYGIAAGLSWYGPCDFEDQNLFNHDDRPDFKDRFEKRIAGEEKVTPAEKLRLYREISPVNYLKKDSPPLLMIQGDKDTTIPVKHAYRMAEKARELGAPVQTLIVKNAGHNWRKVDAEINPGRNEIINVTVAFFVAQIPHSAAETKADFYLSPDGSDTWSGTLTKPNSQGTDGPFATLEKARDAVRDLKKRKPTDIAVSIRGGTYHLNKTVVFGLEDSGIGGASITYEAYPGETPVFSSGKEIKGWEKVSGELPGLPRQAQGKVWKSNVSAHFYTLYDAEGMLPRARSAGFIPLTGGSRNRLHFPEGKLKNWPNVTDVEIVVRPHHAWISNFLPLASVDEGNQVAKTSIDATYAMNRLHFLKTTESCWVENVLEELDEPGEWVINTKEGRVYLWRRNESAVLAPQLIELLRIEGEIDKRGPKDRPVRNLCFRGLTFMHGDRYTLAENDAGLQHDWDMLDKANALVRLRGTENCIIEQCHFTNSGSGAIRVDLHAQKNEISGNHIEHMGGGGILLCGYGPGTKDVSRDNLVYNNHIHHAGRIYMHSPGIMLWQSGENRVANNLIHHMPYCGMIVSGCVTHFFTRKGREVGRTIRRHEIHDLPRKPTLEDVRPYLHTHDNLIEYNEIHNVMEKMGDGNGIYIRGAGAGNVIRRNYIHHLVTPMKMQAAIRTDGGQRDTLIAENLIYKCMAQGIILKLNNRAENNIVADVLAPPRGYYLSLREGPLTGAAIKRNIFFSTGKDTVFIDELPAGKGRATEDRRGRALARAKDANTDYNFYYSTVDPELGKSMLEKQQSDGVDAHSLAVDPLFVDPENGDFRLKPNSPALKLGFVPFDKSKVGLRGQDTNAHYPSFSWDRIPLYMHVRKAKSYTDEEIAFLAKFPLITFEKANGHQDHGSIEAGTLVAAKAVKEINPDAKILYYRNVIVHYGGYAANKELDSIPGALLQDENGRTKLVRNRVEAYDLSNPDLRQWWTNTCRSMTADPHIDGIFLDGNIKALVPGYLARQVGEAKKKQTMDGYHLMMEQTRQAIGPDKLMLANILRARFDDAGLEFLDYFDGSYLEGFFHNVAGASYEEYVAKGIEAMQRAARQGKIIAFTSGFAGPKNKSVGGIDEAHAKVKSDAQARAALTYPLAIFLICAEKHSYFRIHEGYSANEDDRWMRWFPEYDRPLGPPDGSATKDRLSLYPNVSACDGPTRSPEANGEYPMERNGDKQRMISIDRQRFYNYVRIEEKNTDEQIN